MAQVHLPDNTAFIAAMVVVVIALSSFSIIAPGCTGVVFNIWTGSLRTVGQGMAVRIPWLTRVQSDPTAPPPSLTCARRDDACLHGQRR